MIKESITKQIFKIFPAKFAFAAFVICALFSISALGKTLRDYKKSVEKTRDLVIELEYPEDEIFESQAGYEKFEKEILAEIRQSLPPGEKVEWENSSIETDNRWLTEKLNEFENEPKDSDKREEILDEISERLDAIEKKVTETENQTASEQTKDEDKRKLAEILKREEYQKPDEQDKSLFQRISEWFVELLSSLFPRPNIEPGSNAGFGKFVSILIFGIFISLILGGIAYLIYRFLPFFARKYQTREKKEKTDRVILGERLSADQNASDLFSEAEKLAREGNLRDAIRKGYIALLCELSDRKIIGLSQHKTNRDYLRDVRGKAELYQNMNGLTLNFERHWYGFDSAEEQDWEEFKSGYQKTVNGQQLSVNKT